MPLSRSLRQLRIQDLLEEPAEVRGHRRLLEGEIRQVGGEGFRDSSREVERPVQERTGRAGRAGEQRGGAPGEQEITGLYPAQPGLLLRRPSGQPTIKHNSTLKTLNTQHSNITQHSTLKRNSTLNTQI